MLKESTEVQEVAVAPLTLADEKAEALALPPPEVTRFARMARMLDVRACVANTIEANECLLAQVCVAAAAMPCRACLPLVRR